jgi:hypothetical protein
LSGFWCLVGVVVREREGRRGERGWFFGRGKREAAGLSDGGGGRVRRRRRLFCSLPSSILSWSSRGLRAHRPVEASAGGRVAARLQRAEDWAIARERTEEREQGARTKEERGAKNWALAPTSLFPLWRARLRERIRTCACTRATRARPAKRPAKRPGAASWPRSCMIGGERAIEGRGAAGRCLSRCAHVAALRGAEYVGRGGRGMRTRWEERAEIGKIPIGRGGGAGGARDSSSGRAGALPCPPLLHLRCRQRRAAAGGSASRPSKPVDAPCSLIRARTRPRQQHTMIPLVRMNDSSS